jgi:hypothetical protein
VSNRNAVIDLIAVGGACVAYVVLEAFHTPKRWSYLALAVLLIGYAIYLARRGTESWEAFGFRTDNLRVGLLPVGLTTFAASVALVAAAAWQGRTVWNANTLLLLGLYPAWAITQQLAFQGLFHRRLSLFVRSPVLVVLATAGAFASVHLGNRLLVALTFTAGVAWSVLYRRWPNLWLLGASHSILAALAYPLVLGDDPLSRL